ncbi:MAG: DUF4080 domain-containing protein [Ruminococcaceae bacterium]|nr:DUF4080 domain-containing protein [Oscillospiraceae bacterium]
MKKWLLVALNAKYSHTSLSVRSICSYVLKNGYNNISFFEGTINDEYFCLLNSILEKNPDVIGFSCYIWNIELVKKLVSDIKEISPHITVFLGGPEVSYNKSLFKEIPQIDFVIRGEGEIPILKLLKGEDNILGVCKSDNEYHFAEMEDMDNIPFCYEGELENLTNRAVYYETSRGCPFKCAFCISSLTKGVRTLPLKRVFSEIDLFSNLKIKRVKLVDRTFNFDKKRAKEIITYILSKKRETCFHFEIGADLLDKELMDIINKADYNTIQFEAGIQSTNYESLKLCDRTTDMVKLKDNLLYLKDSKVRIHLDLIAGLPKEDFESFKKSFDEVYSLSPKVLQVGFLKLLHGSKLREEKEKYNYKFKNTAPYEILSNDFISFFELIKIKKVDKSVDAYFNSGIFKNSLEFILNKNDISPFLFYLKLGEKMGDGKLSLKDKFEILKILYDELFGKSEEFLEYLKLDYVIKERGALPSFLNNFKTKENITKINEFLKDENNNLKIGLSESDRYKDFIKYIDFEIFNFGNKKSLYLFNRRTNDIIKMG